MIHPEVILQIVPRAPGNRDGVGDYSRQLAAWLEKKYGAKTIFIAAQAHLLGRLPGDLRVLSPLRQMVDQLKTSEADAVILHYVNYGYDRWGIPLWLPPALARIRGPRRLLTIFHELYAIGSPCQSAFWLRPLQIRTARRIAQISDLGLVSSQAQGEELARLSPLTPVRIRPVFSNLGEPELTAAKIENRDPFRWVICGGSELIRRSVSSFLQAMEVIAAPYRPRELWVIGGNHQGEVARILGGLKSIKTCYRSNVSVAEASEILAGCAFGWIDYFVQPYLPLSMILKSSVFAALCAHGVISVFPRSGRVIEHEGAALPGPFFVSHSEQSLPAESERARVAQTIYSWYRLHACSAGLADLVWNALSAGPAAD